MPALTKRAAASSGVLAAPPLRISLAGCGAVGGALVELLNADPAAWEVVGGLVRDLERTRPASVAALPLTTDLRRFAATPSEILVEALGGIEPARTLVASALERGASVVTANKALIATHGTELQALADRRGGVLLFDAAVGGGIPAPRALRTSFAGVPIRRLRGILNGTANFLLTRIEEGADYPTALREAQELGYAEADPARDVDGRDAADKIRILSWLAWGVPPAEVRVDVSGILPDPEARVHAAGAEGRRLRLVAEASPGGGGAFIARVAAVEVEPDSAAAHTTGVDNLLEIETEGCGSYTLTGPGAGGAATASAMLADLSEVAGRLRAEASPSSRARSRRRG